MRRLATVAALGLGMAIVGVAPADAQLFNYPVYSAPSSVGGPFTFVAASYGGGLNDVSGKNNAIGAAVGRTGIGDRVTVVGAGALIFIDDPADDEVTLSGAVGVDVLPADAGAQVALNAGLGWMSPGDLTLLHIPVGVSLGTTIEGSSANVNPWIMPRISFNRRSGDLIESNTDTDFGVSGGVAINLPSGIGFHAALDVLIVDDVSGDSTGSWLFGGGVHYIIN